MKDPSQDDTSLPLGGAEIPSSVCVRVTRRCNARCGFCHSPPDDSGEPSLTELRTTFEWLRYRGVSSVKISGGDPTVRRDLPELIAAARAASLQPTLCTNAIRLRDDVLEACARERAKLKVSLHGDAATHNAIMGLDCYDKVLANIKRLLDAGIHVGIHTVLTTRNLSAIDQVAQLALANHVPKVSFIPVIPRGWGAANPGLYDLSEMELQAMRDRVSQLRRDCQDRLDVRIHDLRAKDYFVVESTGSFMIQSQSEHNDVVLLKTLTGQPRRRGTDG